MRKHLAAVGLFLALAITGVMTLTLTSNDTTPVRGKALQLSCLTSGESPSSTLIWFNPQNVKLSTCYTNLNGCTGNTSSYSFTLDNSGGYAYINSLSRENDTGTWKCVYGLVTATIEIKVYSIPSGLSITQNPDQDVDLSVNSAVLQCKTVGCAYPVPTVKWIFKDQTTSSETEYAAVSPAGTQETCTSSEFVYTSTLLIHRYTTFSDNSGKTGTFFCRIEYPDPFRNIISSLSKNIRFAGAPKILDISPDYKGYIGQYTIIQFGVYSNRDENLTVTAQHYNTSGLTQQGIIQKVLPDSLKIYSSPEPDFRASIAIIVRSEYDFGRYLVNVTNNVGSDLTIINIDEQITPEKPMHFHATNIQERQLSLMWQSGYHGRFPQTFVVETSQDNITWTNVSLVSDGNRDGWFTTVIEDFNPGSTYYLRLYGYNKHGRGEFDDEQLVVRMWKESIYTPSVVGSAPVGVSVGGAVGIGVGGVVLGCIGAIITITIRRQLNGSKSSCFSRLIRVSLQV